MSKNKRVAVYLRFKEELDDQAVSYTWYYGNYEAVIEEHEGWQLAGFYVDEGSAKNQTEFKRLLDDCKAGNRNDLFYHAQEGKFDLLITSRLSDFDANLEVCTDTIWELLLARPPVGIYVESLNFCSLMPHTLRYMKYLDAMRRQNEESKRCGGVLWEL